MTATVPHFVGGKWKNGAASYRKLNPSNFAETAVVAPDGSPEDALESLAAATSAAPGWAKLPVAKRSGYLRDAAQLLSERSDTIAYDMASETGKTMTDARAEVLRAVEVIRYTAGLTTQEGEFASSAAGDPVVRGARALGVVAQVSPWNVPLASASWKVAPALLAGNAVVLKVASECPHTAFHFASSFDDAGLPSGVLSVLTGEGGALGGVLITDERVAAMSWTGTDVGVAAIVRDNCLANGKRLQLQLGGINSLVILDDAQLEIAATSAVIGAFSNAGQLRTATRRVFISRPLLAAFRELLVEKVGALVVGSALDDATQVGPIVNAVELAAVESAIGARLARGDRLLAGGQRISGDNYLFAPTVLEVDDPKAIVGDEEVFGPVLTISPFDEKGDLDAGVRLANAASRIVSSGIVTNSPERARAFELASRAGQVHVNGPTIGADPSVPFAGDRFATIGPAELGQSSLDFYLQRYTAYRHVEAAS